jgi:hypothetical protein
LNETHRKLRVDFWIFSEKNASFKAS